MRPWSEGPTPTRALGLCVAVCIACAGPAGAAEQRPLWLAVCKADLAEALTPLAEKRRGEGFEVIVSTEPIAEALTASPRAPDYLLLVGDDEPGENGRSWYLPAKRRELYRWRRVQPREFASDTAWGDLDGDLVPDIAVGRLPARTRDQVGLVVGKILRYEGQSPSLADLRLNVWAGSPAYGAAIDAVSTGALLLMIRIAAPGWVEPWIVSGNPLHPLCGWPPDQPGLVTRQMRRGGLCTVLMGHASAESFFSMTHQGQRICYTAADAEAELAEGPPSPPLWFLSCESGDFTRAGPCLAESFLFLPGGPVATIGATTESHPLPNYFSGSCLLRCLGKGEKRVGRLWLAAQRDALRARNFLVERVLRDVEGKLEEEIDVAKLRRDQILMYALLGDPATRLRMPESLAVRVERTENGWHWKAERPEGAGSLHLGHRPDQPLSPKAAPRPGQPAEARAAFRAANAAAAFTALPSPPPDGPWEGTVAKPGWLRLVTTKDGVLYAAAVKLR